MRSVAIFFMFSLLLFFSCKKETIEDNSIFLSTSLTSNDSLKFDTVFTASTTPTQIFKIFNYNKTEVFINNIELAGGANSPYKININGETNTQFQNIHLSAGDSLYVFVNITVAASQSKEAFSVTDSLGIFFNNQKRNIVFNAMAQNVVYLNETVYTNDAVWTNDLPIVVKGNITVNEGNTLQIFAGTKVYFHQNTGLIVNGKLIVNGNFSPKKRVIFTNDRLDYDYNLLPGSWNGVVFGKQSNGNELNYLTLKNAKTAITDTLRNALSSTLSLNINGCIIENCNNGMKGNNSYWKLANSLIANCGNGFVVFSGGNYLLEFVTIAGFGNRYIAHDYPNMQISDASESGVNTSFLNFSLKNSIVYGSLTDEILLQLNGNNHAVFIENSITKSSGLSNVQYRNSLQNIDPKFLNLDERRMLYDFRLADDSPAKNFAIQSENIYLTDIIGTQRNTNNATAGCFE